MGVAAPLAPVRGWVHDPSKVRSRVLVNWATAILKTSLTKNQSINSAFHF